MTKNRPIQIMIVLATLSLAGIIGVQVFWVSQAVSAEEQSFDHNVRMSLRAVADNMCQIDGNELIADKPIDRISRNYFVARLRYNIDISVLDSLIKHQFEMRSVDQNYEYGIYNCESDRMVFGNQVSQTSDRSAARISLPKLATDEYYFGVYFPNKTGGILSDLSLWKYLTGATLIMVGFFCYGLIIVLRQRRFSEIQNDFIDNVTHELRTPLATLKLSTNALKQSNDPDKIRQYADIIAHETSRLELQMSEILSASSMSHSGKHSLKMTAVSDFLHSLMTKAHEDYPGIAWDIEIEDDMHFETNTKALEIVLRNLFDNAAKYGRGKISFSAKKKRNQFEIQVSDNGSGIPKKYQSKIYDKFFRVPTDNLHDVKGHGLGMYLAKQHLKKIRGSIRLNSNQSGSTFTILLPY